MKSWMLWFLFAWMVLEVFLSAIRLSTEKFPIQRSRGDYAFSIISFMVIAFTVLSTLLTWGPR